MGRSINVRDRASIHTAYLWKGEASYHDVA